jgi:hypothetical protein
MGGVSKPTTYTIARDLYAFHDAKEFSEKVTLGGLRGRRPAMRIAKSLDQKGWLLVYI